MPRCVRPVTSQETGSAADDAPPQPQSYEGPLHCDQAGNPYPGLDRMAGATCEGAGAVRGAAMAALEERISHYEEVLVGVLADQREPSGAPVRQGRCLPQRG